MTGYAFLALAAATMSERCLQSVTSQITHAVHEQRPNRLVFKRKTTAHLLTRARFQCASWLRVSPTERSGLNRPARFNRPGSKSRRTSARAQVERPARIAKFQKPLEVGDGLNTRVPDRTVSALAPSTPFHIPALIEHNSSRLKMQFLREFAVFWTRRSKLKLWSTET